MRAGWTPTNQVGRSSLSCHEGDARRSAVTVQPVASAPTWRTTSKRSRLSLGWTSMK